MSRPSRIYIAIGRDGKPLLARVVKYEMKHAIQKADDNGYRTDLWTYWSLPNNNRNEIKQVTKFFFKK